MGPILDLARLRRTASSARGLLRRGRVRRDGPAEAGVPVLRRADAHPDAPARRPLRVSEDLGVPVPVPVPVAPVAARRLPADLDTPLAAIDPGAIPAVPREPVRAVPPLARRALIDAGDQIETFELTPIRRAPSAPPQGAAPPSSLAALLDRLEESAARRSARPGHSFEETLGMLRGLAAR